MSEYKEYTVRVYKNSTEYLNSKCKLHREDGPAVEWSDGSKEWWFNGKLHREDGPAIEDNNGNKTWYLKYFIANFPVENFTSYIWKYISQKHIKPETIIQYTFIFT